MNIPALIPKSIQNNKTIPIGAKVVITNPLRVIRVGYPMSIDDAISYVETTMSTDIKNLFKSIGYIKTINLGVELNFAKLATVWPPIDKVGRKTYNEIVKALAYEYLHQTGFGGKERTIHVKEYLDYQGKILTVADKKVVKTGTYYPPGGDAEDWYPGGLDNCKTHVLLKLWDWNFYCKSNNLYDEAFWIESCNVKLE